MSHFDRNNVIYSVGEIETLVQKAKAGDGQAFETLYKHFLTPVYRYVFARTQNKDITEDIVQTVFLKWYTSLASYEVKKSPLAYLFVIARRLLIDEGRRQTPLSLDEENAPEPVDEAILLEEEFDTRLLSSHVFQVLETLSDVEQDVISLYYLSELRTEEIAALLERTEVSVRKIKSRALAHLREKLSHIHE